MSDYRVELTDELGNRQMPVTSTQCVINNEGSSIDKELNLVIHDFKYLGNFTPIVMNFAELSGILGDEEEVAAYLKSKITEEQLAENNRILSEIKKVVDLNNCRIILATESYGPIIYEADIDNVEDESLVYSQHPSFMNIGGFGAFPFEKEITQVGSILIVLDMLDINSYFKRHEENAGDEYELLMILLAVLTYSITFYGTISPGAITYPIDLGIVDYISNPPHYNQDLSITSFETDTYIITCSGGKIRYVPHKNNIVDVSLLTSQSDLICVRQYIISNILDLFAESTDRNLIVKFIFPNSVAPANVSLVTAEDGISINFEYYYTDTDGLLKHAIQKLTPDGILTVVLNETIQDTVDIFEPDTELSETSTNSVQNKVITKALNNKVDKIEGKQLSTEDFTADLKNKLELIPDTLPFVHIIFNKDTWEFAEDSEIKNYENLEGKDILFGDNKQTAIRTGTAYVGGGGIYIGFIYSDAEDGYNIWLLREVILYEDYSYKDNNQLQHIGADYDGNNIVISSILLNTNNLEESKSVNVAIPSNLKDNLNQITAMMQDIESFKKVVANALEELDDKINKINNSIEEINTKIEELA